jgi:hypothetical protein
MNSEVTTMKNRNAKFPLGTLAYYGPDNIITTKIVAGVLYSEDAKPIIRRYVASDCLQNERIWQQISDFFEDHGVKTVLNPGGNIGCPHEECKDYPRGDECPFCPYWTGKQ